MKQNSKSIILHIGASKCGSSAIQMALTASPSIERKDGSYINYAVFNAGAGKIVDKLDLKKSCGIQGFRSSPNANRMLAGSLGDIRRRLKAYKTDLLFSSEGWLFQPRQWSEILHFLDVDVSIVVYVRPQVPVLNSAWWQWGAWSDQNFDDWMEHRLNASLWGARVKRWADLKCVKSVTVRPVPEEVVADFYEHVLDAPKPQLVLRPKSKSAWTGASPVSAEPVAAIRYSYLTYGLCIGQSLENQ